MQYVVPACKNPYLYVRAKESTLHIVLVSFLKKKKTAPSMQIERNNLRDFWGLVIAVLPCSMTFGEMFVVSEYRGCQSRSSEVVFFAP